MCLVVETRVLRVSLSVITPLLVVRVCVIDVLLVAREELPANPIKRLSLIEECLMSFPGVEPLILTTGELKALARKNPLIRKNINEGVVLKRAKEQIYESGEQSFSHFSFE